MKSSLNTANSYKMARAGLAGPNGDVRHSFFLEWDFSSAIGFAIWNTKTFSNLRLGPCSAGISLAETPPSQSIASLSGLRHAKFFLTGRWTVYLLKECTAGQRRESFPRRRCRLQVFYDALQHFAELLHSLSEELRGN